MTMTVVENYVRTRSEDAFRGVVQQYIHLVYSACLRQLRDAHLAEDATQAVFVLLHRRGGRVPAERISSWLLTAARFTCANMRKNEHRRSRREVEVAMSSSASTRAAALDDEVLGLLDEALGKISAMDREAVALHYFQNQSYAAVGEALGVSEEAARKRVGRALEKLRAYFGRRGVSASSAALATLLPTLGHAATLGASVVKSLTDSIVITCQSGVATPALAIAKGTQIMMYKKTMKNVAVATLIGAALIAAGWWGIERATRADWVPAANRTMAVAGGTRVVSLPRVKVPLDFTTPLNTLGTYCAALKAGDAEGVKSCCVSTATNGPPTAEDAFLTFTLAQNRLIGAAAEAFHSDGQEARQSPSVDQVLEKVVAYDRVSHQSATIDGDKATLAIRLPQGAIKAFPESIRPEIEAFIDLPIKFVREGNAWKLAHSPCHGMQVKITLLDRDSRPVGDDGMRVRVIEEYAGVYDEIASGIAGGVYPTWKEAGAALNAGKQALHEKYNLSDINIEVMPPAAGAASGG